jgi:outer membrane immunogenic protein
MKKVLLATVALAALGMTQASAADLAARPYTKAPAMAPGINWSGFYIGAMGGYAWSDDQIKGGFGGGTIGYNWQAPGSMWVWGLEADAAGADIKASVTDIFGTAETKIRGFGSVTGRVGVTAGAALFYAKGGYGWANTRASVSVPGLAISDTKTLSGWTVGGGAEYMFAPSWSAKAEYMYANYGNETFFSGIAPTEIGGVVHSVKAGINYHFN